jgi:hypothetical protein
MRMNPPRFVPHHPSRNGRGMSLSFAWAVVGFIALSLFTSGYLVGRVTAFNQDRPSIEAAYQEGEGGR